MSHCFGCGKDSSPDLVGMCAACFSAWWHRSSENNAFIKMSRLMLEKAKLKEKELQLQVA